MMKSSIHTLQLQTQISPDECKMIKSVFHKLHLSAEYKSSVKPQSSVDKKSIEYWNNIIVYRRFSYYGMNSITILQNIRIPKQNMIIIKYYLYATINPYNALHNCQNSGADIIEPEKIEDAMNIVIQHLNSLLSIEIASRFSINRLDFCIDLVFPIPNTCR